MDLVRTHHARNASGRGGRTAAFNFYELRDNLFEFVEGFYNTTRRHSTLGFLSPAQFETLSLPNINKTNG